MKSLMFNRFLIVIFSICLVAAPSLSAHADDDADRGTCKCPMEGTGALVLNPCGTCNREAECLGKHCFYSLAASQDTSGTDKLVPGNPKKPGGPIGPLFRFPVFASARCAWLTRCGACSDDSNWVVVEQCPSESEECGAEHCIKVRRSAIGRPSGTNSVSVVLDASHSNISLKACENS